MEIIISQPLEKEAKDYALKSRSYTSNRHDFHEGGLEAKERKMFEGKLGEKAIKQFFTERNIKFKEDTTSFDEADFYDFIVYSLDGKELKVDVKTRTESFHIRTLEMVEQMKNKPKDIYISVRLHKHITPYKVDIIGCATKEDFLSKNRIQNQGNLNNYVLYDNELTNIETLLSNLQKI